MCYASHDEPGQQRDLNADEESYNLSLILSLLAFTKGQSKYRRKMVSNSILTLLERHVDIL